MDPHYRLHLAVQNGEWGGSGHRVDLLRFSQVGSIVTGTRVPAQLEGRSRRGIITSIEGPGNWGLPTQRITRFPRG